MRSCYSVEAELAFIALVLLAWQAVRIPLEGNVDVSVEHARAVLGLEHALSIDVEAWLIHRASASRITGDLAWMYTNIHLPVLFGAIAAVRVLAPDRYPRLRTTFVLSFLPAIAVIGLYPLAPPHWLPELGLGPSRRPGSARRHVREALPQLDGRRGEPALRLRALRRRVAHLDLPALVARVGRARVSGTRLRRHRRDGEPLRARLRRRRAHLRGRGRLAWLLHRDPRRVRLRRPDERGRRHGHRLCGRGLGLRLARHAVAAALEQRLLRARPRRAESSIVLLAAYRRTGGVGGGWLSAGASSRARGGARAARTHDIGVAAGHAVGGAVDRVVVGHHVRRLRKVGWSHALSAPAGGWAEGVMPPREGNSVEVLIDGAAFLPRAAEELAKAQSHVHITGWYFTPELALTRNEDPVTVRNLLAELAERIPVRVLIWSGAPVRVFSPTRRDVREMVERFCRGTKITCEFDSCVRFWHCHHEKTIVVDDRVAFVGGIDLTYDGGDPYDSPEHKARGGVGWHDIATRLHGPIVADVAEHFRLRWHGSTEEALPPPAVQDPAGDLTAQLVRTIPEQHLRPQPAARRLLGARVVRPRDPIAPSVSSTSRTSSCGRPRSSSSSRRSCVPARDDFRIIVLLPVNANDGADVSRGQVAALIHADDGNGRFLACSVYARVGTLHDPSTCTRSWRSSTIAG